jgi:hypothetical protein
MMFEQQAKEDVMREAAKKNPRTSLGKKPVAKKS